MIPVFNIEIVSKGSQQRMQGRHDAWLILEVATIDSGRCQQRIPAGHLHAGDIIQSINVSSNTNGENTAD